MSKYIVEGSDLTSVANAIRSKAEISTDLEFPSEFIEAIGDISGGAQPKMNPPTTVSITNSNTVNVGLPTTNGNFCNKVIVHFRRATSGEPEYYNTLEVPMPTYSSPFSFNLDNYVDTSDKEYVNKDKSHITVSLSGDNFEMSNESAAKTYTRRYLIQLHDGDDDSEIGEEYVRYAQLPKTVPTKAGYTFSYWGYSDGARCSLITSTTGTLWAYWV